MIKLKKEPGISEMNKPVLFLCGLFIVLTISYLEGNAYAAQIEQKVFSEEDQVQAIKDKCSIIDVDTVNRYKSKQKDLGDYTLEGALAIGYYDKKGLIKVVVKGYGETFRVLETYYFSSSNLIYVTSTILRYIYPVGSEKGDPVFEFDNPVDDEIGRIEENRYYFNKDKLVKWEGYKFDEQEVERLVDKSKDLIQLFKTK